MARERSVTPPGAISADPVHHQSAESSPAAAGALVDHQTVSDDPGPPDSAEESGGTGDTLGRHHLDRNMLVLGAGSVKKSLSRAGK